MQFRTLTTAVLLFLAAGICSDVAVAGTPGRKQEGVGTDRTRYIYPEGAGPLGVTLRQYAKESYLVQARVRGLNPVTGEGEEVSAPFFIRQPLVKTMPGGRYGFQVIQTKPVMVKDRESVYLLSFTFIPSEKKDGPKASQTARAVLVMTWNVKLFYRPLKLKDGKVAKAAEALTFSRQGSTLRVNNPTPYWITFNSLKVGAVPLPDGALRRMVPPFAGVDYALPATANAGSVTWRIINEDGDVTDAVTTPL